MKALLGKDFAVDGSLVWPGHPMELLRFRHNRSDEIAFYGVDCCQSTDVFIMARRAPRPRRALLD